MTNKTLVFILIATTLSGCASLREREEIDPGHGAIDGILQKLSLVAETAACPLSILQKVNMSSAAIDPQDVFPQEKSE